MVPNLKFRTPSKKVCYIFLSANGGLFGDVINKSFSNLKNYLKRIPPDELLVVGSVGARLVEFSEIKNTVPYTYFPLSDASGDRENLDGILRYALDFEKIVVFYTKYVEILDQSPVADSVTGDIIFEESVQNIQNGEQKLEEDFLYEPDIEKILAIFENQMIASLFEQKVLESGLSKFTSRMVSLDSASEKIKQNMGRIRIEYQKMKHSESNRKATVQIAGFMSQS
jgi:F0F1-type ATP synthase gamma subunit